MKTAGPAAATGAPPPAEAPVAFGPAVGPLLLLTSIFFLNFIARVVQAPLMPAIERDLGITHAAAGSIFFAISVGYFIALMGSGFVSARLTHRGNILLSGFAVGAAMFATAASAGIWGVRAGLFVLGLATGLYLPSAIAALTGFVAQPHWGKAIAVHEVAPNLSFVMAPLFAEAVLALYSWRTALAILGIAAILAALSFARFGRVGRFAGEAPNFRSLSVLAASPSFWVMVLLFGLGISGTLGTFTMLPLYLVEERGFDREWANTLIALSRLSGIAMAFLGGWVTDRFGPKRTLGFVFLFTGAFTVLLGVAPGAWTPFIVFLQPMVAVCFFPAGFAALGMVAPPEARNIAVSFTTPAAFMLGGGVVPALIGAIGDHASFSLGIALVGALICAGALVSRGLALPR